MMEDKFAYFCKALLAISTLALVGGCTNIAVSTWQQPAIAAATATADIAPVAPREFRAAWVATVGNIDWPSRRDLTVAQQQAEMIKMIERAKELNLNALILQVRTSADALYPSDIEPWSEYLTGEQGKAPVPFYDPLKMWVEESHKRGIELHAWFNPYRARHTQAKSPSSPTHIANKIPSAVKSYGGYLWMDPGEAAASNQTLNVILDVVRRYDIDGVHIDDYFYPYPVPVAGSAAPPPSPDDTPAPVAELTFPDEPSWQAYQKAGGKLVRADWRRQNVNELIERIYKGIHAEKNWVKFGISPFGLPKPSQRPAGISGFSQYDKLYADAELWLQQGWCDYFTPQLYWPIDQKAQAYGALLDYWMTQNTSARHIWPGLYTSRINNTDKSWKPEEIINQIALTRMRGDANAFVRGHVHFSMVALSENRKGINDQLKAAAYSGVALMPPSPWLDKSTPAAPQVTAILSKTGRANIKLKLTPGAVVAIGVGAANGNNSSNGNSNGGKNMVSTYAAWMRYGTEWRFTTLPAMRTVMSTSTAANAEFDVYIDSPAGALNMIAVSAVDRFGNEGPRMIITPDLNKGQ